MSAVRMTLLSLAVSSTLLACEAGTTDEVDLAGTVAAAVEATLNARPTQPTATPTQAPSQTPLPTSTPLPTATESVLQRGAQVRVSVSTNCRAGPGADYAKVTTFRTDQVAEVRGRSTVTDFYYVENPNKGDSHCWLWGEYATVEGDIESVPVLTPAPSPIPRVDFTLYRHSFSECGSKRVNFILINNGASTFESARLHVEDLTSSEDLYGPSKESTPFADNPSSCPSDKGSETLPPGSTAYLNIPLTPFEAGHDAAAYIRLCTAQDTGGSCVDKTAYFRIPEG